MPAFVIFSNATLEDMAVKKPRSRQEFLGVSGVGEIAGHPALEQARRMGMEI